MLSTIAATDFSSATAEQWIQVAMGPNGSLHSFMTNLFETEMAKQLADPASALAKAANEATKNYVSKKSPTAWLWS